MGSRALLSLGSNLGDRIDHLRRAVAGFGDSVVTVSPVYETPPWPPGDQAPSYLNAVVLVEDEHIDAYGWLRRAQAIEQPTPKRTHHAGWQFPARTLDIDVIMVWDHSGKPIISDDPTLLLPHPRVHERAFVLKPWLDVQPDGELPGRGKLADLLKDKTVAKDLAQIQKTTGVL